MFGSIVINNIFRSFNLSVWMSVGFVVIPINVLAQGSQLQPR